MAQSYQIVQAVGSPSCKIIMDIYHQQITEGNIIPNIDACWDAIAAFHLGDTPGRKEPGTGELNYRRSSSRSTRRDTRECCAWSMARACPEKRGRIAVIEAYRCM